MTVENLLGDRPPRAPCICYAFWIQTEAQEGEFHDPENQLPRNAAGKKFRIMHNGCPQHDGNSARTMPTAQQLQDLMALPQIPAGAEVYPTTNIPQWAITYNVQGINITGGRDSVDVVREGRE